MYETKKVKCGGQGRNRTADASLFRAALYRLSYLAVIPLGPFSVPFIFPLAKSYPAEEMLASFANRTIDSALRSAEVSHGSFSRIDAKTNTGTIYFLPLAGVR